MVWSSTLHLLFLPPRHPGGAASFSRSAALGMPGRSCGKIPPQRPFWLRTQRRSNRDRLTGVSDMVMVAVNEEASLFISPAISDFSPVLERGVDVVIDLEGGLDHGVPTVPNQILYVYFPIYDEDLPNLAKLDGVARMGADLVRSGHRVLSHCGMGFNRSALVAGRILVELGVPGAEAVARLRAVRPGALFNEVFAAHLESLPACPAS